MRYIKLFFLFPLLPVSKNLNLDGLIFIRLRKSVPVPPSLTWPHSTLPRRTNRGLLRIEKEEEEREEGDIREGEEKVLGNFLTTGIFREKV